MKLFNSSVTAFRRLTTKQKLSSGFMTIFILLSLPYLLLLCYLLPRELLPFRTALFFVAVFLVFWSAALLFSIYAVIQPVFNISNAASKIFETYIESSMVSTEAERNFQDVSDDTIRLMHHVQHLMDKEYTAEMLRKQAELDALQSQINPHFLYNTLESIRGQAVYEGVNTIADMAKALSDFFRYSIQSKHPLVQLSEELYIVEAYMKIQNYRFNNKYQIDLQLEDTALLEHQLPRLTLQPLIENALLHGLRNSLNPTETITIQAYCTKKRFIISVSDRGIGIHDSDLESINHLLNQPLAAGTLHMITSKSIGLKNINERIKLHYGNEYGLKLYSVLNYGTVVELSLPVCT